MNNQWKKNVTAILLSATLAASGLAAYAQETPPTAASAASSHQLTDQLQVQLKSLSNERIAGGIQVGAVLRITNTSGSLTRMPEHELRVRTSDGLEYTLEPSASNARSVQPSATVEMNYLSVLQREDEVSLSELSWVEVDEYVYPKLETYLLILPVADLSWSGSGSAVTDPAAQRKWGEAFTLPFEKSPLVYRTVDWTETSNGDQPVTVVKIQVDNPGGQRETIPAFSLDGRWGGRSFSGSRIEQGPISIDVSEKKYIHFAIPTDVGVSLGSLTVVTPESFQQGAPNGQTSAINYTVGRLTIARPFDNIVSERAILPRAEFGGSIAVDTVTGAVDPKLDVSFMDFRFYENEEQGYKTAVAKFKLTNTGSQPVQAPALTSELASTEGYRYASLDSGAGSPTGASAAMPGAAGAMPGAASAVSGGATQQIMPNSSIMMTQAYVLPEGETGDLWLKLFDAVTAAPYTSTVAAFKFGLQPEQQNRSGIAFYPFDVTIKDWDFSGSISQGMTGASYNYLVKLDLAIELKDNVIAGQEVPKLGIELVDKNGVVMAYQTQSFTGAGKLIQGPQTIVVSNVGTQLQSGVTVNIYEAMDTPSGHVKRLVYSF